MGKIRNKLLEAKEQYGAFDDQKLRMTLIGLADKYSEQIRDLIYKAYNDDELASIYRGWRASGVYEKGGKSKVHKELIRFPNAHVYDFIDTVMRGLYGRDWLQNKRALKHELIRPWWIVNKI